ncbi:hypothetical protein [Actinomarinicola tropica]|uniref:Uncharacterized protein n=1 Tax=Actinomarinicola tropica TaxID=2789776 RepID=A0A5Q2RMH3_9ACTN|nr:hypothetical protein [Actinomarinicola tropica]QGG95287.1 hypothetical protein GH723_09370 [Actinomarinicola tropica]
MDLTWVAPLASLLLAIGALGWTARRIGRELVLTSERLEQLDVARRDLTLATREVAASIGRGPAAGSSGPHR